ncbi:MAG: hypothetical protein H6710_17530 [Myxococcales bacterium]|nr:hypothetical protein [Myxococcales bacterium]
MSELSVHKDHRLASLIEPGLVDVFFSAHTHEVLDEPLVGASGALVVEAGNDGWVGQLDVDVDAGGAIVGTQWTLHPVDANVPEDPTVAAAVAAARAPFLGPDVLIEVESGFMPSPLADKPLTRSIDTVIGETTGANVRAILEGLLTYQEGGWVDGFSGITASLDLSRDDGDRVLDLTLPGMKGEADTLVVAGCRRPVDDGDVICSHGGFTNVTDLLGDDMKPMGPVDLFEWGLAQPLPAARQSLKDQSGTPRWPTASFVQPLEGVP